MRLLRRVLLVVSLLVLPSVLTAAASAATASDELRALHDKVLRAHRTSNVDLLLEDEAEDYVVANRGDISRPTLAQRRERFGPYLRSTRFTEYRDLSEPIVTISADGTMGWVVVQIQARGTQTRPPGTKEPIEFVCAWIELYQRRAGKWCRTGNVSNFKPGVPMRRQRRGRTIGSNPDRMPA